MFGSEVIEESGSNRTATHVGPPDPSVEIVSICVTEVKNFFTKDVVNIESETFLEVFNALDLLYLFII